MSVSLLESLEEIMQKTKRQLELSQRDMEFALRQSKRGIEAEIANLEQNRNTLLADIEQQKQVLQQQKQDMLREVEERSKQVAEEEKRWREIEAKARRVSYRAPKSKVKLNVGGQIHTTTIDTLANEKGTYFQALFSELIDTQPDEDGEIFIDRDPRNFNLVLNHLRGMDILPYVGQLTAESRALLEQDADYYQIESLQRLFLRLKQYEEDWFEIDKNFKVRDGDIEMKTTTSGSISVAETYGFYSTSNGLVLFGNRAFSCSVRKWSVRIDKGYNPGFIMLGVCRGSERKQCENNYLNCIWGATGGGYSFEHGEMGNFDYHKGCGKGNPWQTGTIVQCTLDCDKGKLTVGDLTMDVPAHEELYPAFIIPSMCAISLLAPIDAAREWN